MVAELIRDLCIVIAVKLLDCLADGRVQHPALLRHKLLISDAANPVVTEVDPLAIGGQDVAAHQLLDSYRRVHFADLSGPREQREREVTADCGGYLTKRFGRSVRRSRRAATKSCTCASSSARVAVWQGGRNAATARIRR